MNEFIQDTVESFTSGGFGGGREEVVEQQTDYYSSNTGGPGNAPNVPHPWISQWSEQERTYVYINQETGERSFQAPFGGVGGGVGGGFGGGVGGGFGGGGYQQQQVYQQDTYVQEERSSGGNGLGYGAMGVAAGLAGGALLGYEGEKIHNEWDDEKYRVENDVENFPENAAQWTGDKVGEAEYAVDRVGNDIENFPENAADWVGDKVGGVERFGDEIGNAFDAGKAQGQDGW